MWQNLGFKESPFDVRPLKVDRSHVSLLMGREKDQVAFITSLEGTSEGVHVLSGVPGVGKTSFLNIQQYLLENEEAGYGPKLLASRELCPVQPSDEPRHIAIRCVQSLCSSVEQYCNLNMIDMPKNAANAQMWVTQNKPTTVNFGVSIMNVGVSGGREIHIPTISETTFETINQIIDSIVKEITGILELDGCFIVLDNVENLHVDDLNDCLMTFRDSLFTIANIRWVLIGQSGLGSLIQSTNPKVYQRITSCLELKPIEVDNLIQAVERRVNKFHLASNSKKKALVSPIVKDVYLKLFTSSNGEIRFVFKYCHSICVKLVENVRNKIIESNKAIGEETFHSYMGEFMVNNQISAEYSNHCLKSIILEELGGLNLTDEEKAILKMIGNIGIVKPKDSERFKSFGIRSQQGFIKYLSKFHMLNLVRKRQVGAQITYELRGISIFALEYEIL